jgi:hypothetical protein
LGKLILGHSTIVVTQRYARLGDDLVKTEANRVYRSQTASDKSAASSVILPHLGRGGRAVEGGGLENR